MITKEEYLKAKKIVEEYIEEFRDGTNSSMYCVECQALNEQECFCEDIQSEECSICLSSHGNHAVDCPYNTDPFDNLLRDGYD